LILGTDEHAEVPGLEGDAGQRVAIEDGDERLERFLEHALQSAAIRDDALVASTEAFDESEVRLRCSYHVTKDNLIGWPRETQSS
jgi:hypothetical protein